MNQVAANQMRLYDLPSKLLCRVLNVELKVPASTPPSPTRFPRSIPPNFLILLRAPKFDSVASLFLGIFGRRRRTRTRSTRRSCSCRSRK